MILVLKASYRYPLENKRWDTLMNILSIDLKSEVEKYVRWEDQHNALFGKLLVYLAYYILMEEKLNFDRYKKGNNNKPFLKGSSLNFNISHSAKTVVCAISKQDIKLGIDIEKIKEIDIGGLKNIFHESEFNRIIQADNHVEFYRYWTRKEAFTKAIGKGIVMPLSTIDTTKEIISEDKDNYYLESYRLNKFFCSIASNKKKCTTNWIEVIF